QAAHPAFEQRQAFGVAEAIGQRFADLEVDAAGPHARVGAFFGGRADQRRFRENLFEIFADRGDLAQKATVVEFERRGLPRRVDRNIIGWPAVLAAAQVNLDLGDLDTLFGHEQLHDAWVGADTVIKFHDYSLIFLLADSALIVN